jgi:hypothetical protein
LVDFQRLFAKGYLLESGDCIQPGSAERTLNAFSAGAGQAPRDLCLHEPKFLLPARPLAAIANRPRSEEPVQEAA